ncbi:MAG: hypothetical protein ACE145_10260 [Terriglobia bacterium]
MQIDEKQVLTQIDDIIEEYDKLRAQSKFDDLSDLSTTVVLELATRLYATVQRLAPPGSSYAMTAEQLVAQYPLYSFPFRCSKLLTAILRAMKADFMSGNLRSIQELVHADLFGDFLEMATHLLEEGYKDPAAVLAGGVLEEQLRKLSSKHGVSTVQGGRPKKAETMNSELASANAYSKLDQKNITAWLDLRNKAAHGKYSEYAAQQVSLLIQSIRDFLTRVPA